jgi:DNA-binding transcriptional ArsR family regulator
VTESHGGVNGELTYDPEIGPGYFTQIRSDFMRHDGFKPLVKVLYIVLLSYAAEGVKAWPGEATLARQCAVSEPTLRVALKALQAASLLTVKRRGQGLTNLYHLRKLTLLPPKPERKKLAFSHERKNIPIKNASGLASRAQESDAKVHTEQIHKEDVVIENRRAAIRGQLANWRKRHGLPADPAAESVLTTQLLQGLEWVALEAASLGARSVAEVVSRLEQGVG